MLSSGQLELGANKLAVATAVICLLSVAKSSKNFTIPGGWYVGMFLFCSQLSELREGMFFLTGLGIILIDFIGVHQYRESEPLKL